MPNRLVRGHKLVVIPTLHAGQAQFYRGRAKRNAVRCGRRWGKTKLIVTRAADAAAKGRRVGIFAPENKQLHEPYDDLAWVLRNVKASSNKQTGKITTDLNGVVDFWQLTDNELAGRGREYDLILIDEAAFTKNGQMTGIWEKSIEPTMATKPDAEVDVYSTPNGVKTDNFFYALCHDPKYGFTEFHAPSLQNPLVSRDFIEARRLDSHPMVFRQEYLAEFVDWSGVSFFEQEKLLVDGKPVPNPSVCDAVFAVIDTAMKSGLEHDGLAVAYFAVSRNGIQPWPLAVLDWDLLQLEGSLLEAWLPTVYQRLEELARGCRARSGSLGAFIEDKVSGTILIQQAARRNWPAHAIDSKLTALGKDERALSVSGYVYRGAVKFTEHAYSKVSMFKGATRNHLLTQVTSFRMGQKNMADDALDTFTYGISIALGNEEGY